MSQIDILTNNPINEVELYDGLGYVKLVDVMPRLVPEGRTAEIAITRNARVSYKILVDKTPEQDAKLLNFLISNHHTSPLESVVFQFQMCIPIFVERQLIRHRTARVNEQSMRYTTAPDSYYYPKLRMQSQNNKQCSTDEPVPEHLQKLWVIMQTQAAQLHAGYLELVAGGVAREVARTILPVCLMTNIMWQMDLHNLVHFLKLRMAPDAQREIRELAVAIFHIIKTMVPVSAQSLDDEN